jgi:hypothetical protein
VLREILKELDDKLTAEDLDLMIEEIDSDGSGTVDFDGKLNVRGNIYRRDITRKLTLELISLQLRSRGSFEKEILQVSRHKRKLTRMFTMIHYFKKPQESISLQRMMFSGFLRRVALVRTDISEELIASFIRVKRLSELGTTLAVTCNRRTLRRNTACVGC